MKIKSINRYSGKFSAILSISVLLAVLFLSSIMPPSAFSIQPPVITSAYSLQRFGQPRMVDPCRASDLPSRELIQNVYEPLIFFSDKPLAPDADTNFSGHPEYVADLSQFAPMLATAMPSIDPFAKTWTFTVNTSATFQPWIAANGSLIPATALTAADVEYTFERMLVQDMLGAPSWMIALPGTGYMYYDAFDANPATNTIDPPANEEILGNLINDFITTSGSDVTFHFATDWPNVRPYTLLYQIFAHTCSSIVSKAFCIEHGCWDDSFAPGWSKYRRYPSNSYTPLDTWVETSLYANNSTGNRNGWGNGDVPAMIGTGPYKFTSWDKANGEWKLDYYPQYWRGWAEAGNKGGVPGVSFCTTIIGKAIDQWKTAEMLFLEGEYDELEVPRAHMYDLLISQSVPIGGLRLYYDMPALKNEVMVFNFFNNLTSPYQSKVSGKVVLDFFNNTHVRNAFSYALPFTGTTDYLPSAWFNEAIQPSSWWVEGLQPDYKNKSLSPRVGTGNTIQSELQQAYFPQGGGQSVWDTGFETYLVFDFGNDQRRIAAGLIQQTFASLGSKYKVNIVDATRLNPIQSPQYRDLWEQRMLPVFFVCKSADFVDPDSFARPYMYSYGEFAYFQSYSDPLVDYLIDLGVTQPDVIASPPPDYPAQTNRNGTYQELQYIYWRDVPSMPLAQFLERRWTRDWVKGWYYNELYPGDYFYDLYKSSPASGAVDLGFMTITAGSDVNDTTLIFHGQMRIGNHGGRFIGPFPIGDTNPQKMHFSVSVTYKAGGVPVLFASIGLKRNSSLETQYPNATYIVLSPGQTSTTTFEWYEDGVEQFVYADNARDGTSHSGTLYDVWGESYPITGIDSNPADNVVKYANDTIPWRWNASRLEGDVNGNGVVDVFDAILLSGSFGTSAGDAKFNLDTDFKTDSTIDIYDAIMVSINFYGHVP